MRWNRNIRRKCRWNKKRMRKRKWSENKKRISSKKVRREKME
jgi:hypothetical protein